MKVLVTSRTRLNLRAETVYVLRGMAYPKAKSPALIQSPQDSPQSPDQTAYSAIRLFEGSAQRARPDFKRHPGNLKHITRICQLVGGMPLGIELAAAWAGMLSTQEIIAEILSGLDFLTIKMLDAPKRQHSIRAVLDRSWDMLDEFKPGSIQETYRVPGRFYTGCRPKSSWRCFAAVIDLSQPILRKADPNRTVPDSRIAAAVCG